MMTSTDLKQIDELLIKRLKSFATKDDLKNLATKDDLKRLEKEIIEKIDESQMEIVETVEKHKADRIQVQGLEKRVGKLEETVYPA